MVIPTFVQDPVKAEGWIRNANMAAQVVNAFSGGGAAPMLPAMTTSPISGGNVVSTPQQQQAEPISAPTVTNATNSEEGAEDDDDDENRPAPPRAIREVLARLDDNEATALGNHLDEIDSGSFDALGQEAAAIADLDARIAWARGLIRGLDRKQAAAPFPEQPMATGTPPTGGARVPAPLVPLIQQLTIDEQLEWADLLELVDLASLERLTARLLALLVDEALATIRRQIADAQARKPSIAHRAIEAGFRKTNGSTSVGGAS
jgi:hypothetical protein